MESDGQLKGNDMFSAFDEIDLEADEELEEDEIDDEKYLEDGDDGMGELQKCMMDSEYVAEKLSAIYCIEEIAKYQNAQLIEFYNELHDELQRLSLFVHTSIRKESYIALAALISYFHDYCICNLDKTDPQLKQKMLASKFQLCHL